MEANSFWLLGQTKFSSSENETINLAASWAATWQSPLTIAISGPLGAGKTRFVAGIARGLGSSDSVSSPSFALVHTYQSPKWPIYHLDFYRLSFQDEVWQLAFEDYLSHAIVLVEWGEKFPHVFPPSSLQIQITPINPSHRQLTLQTLSTSIPPPSQLLL
ncbi:MAG: tRNA (adenosine(37)-N6)-threonylcarbamoyltransferase complex ATPase subunit type 1 TsaE [Chthoniobacterales bacterium]|nr:tRNA (adenosine(37)-N6)-threonylcarbamoyltransferase complex ATPase subunit type 1 TsaE [Chthoniobacterales bacterium]